MNEQNIDIFEHIHASYYQLTAAERKVADYVLNRQAQVQFMSITQLADECGTADATVSRFCRSLGLKGFNAFKMELARHSAPAAEEKEEHPFDTLPGRCREIGRMGIEAVNQTIELVNESDVERAVEMLDKAGRVYCFGAGGSMLMAKEFAHLFSNVTNKFTAVSDSHMQMIAAASMSQDDVMVLFSYSGATTLGLQELELARARGVKTILVTRFNKSPAANLADVVLRCGSNEGPFQFGSVPAKIAQLIVMDVLFQEYCARNSEQCEKSTEAIAAALSSMHL
ncbi:MAG: MurR/RpiR family transcriptional regulator [Oscillospiraceae bacterium]|nr:MurR/RpiR family transcriptional regulator [Oscillospiraceae bacterium]